MVLIAISTLAIATDAMTMAAKVSMMSEFALFARGLVGVGVGVWVAWSAGFPCCWAYTEAGIAPGPADEPELELGALVEPACGVAVAAYGVTQ